MIQIPRRSVTRFFIPLIDVLTLLFCIFLLMPLIRPVSLADTEQDALKAADSSTREQVADDHLPMTDPAKDNASADVRRVQTELETLQREKIDTLQRRLLIRVLEIDADSGKLFVNETGERLEIANQAEALRFIARHRRDAADKEVYYLFLYPRRLTGYPEERQVKQYEEWFKDVAHGRDNPLVGR
jgi:hypothetical protein